MTDQGRFEPPPDASPEEAACHALAWMWNRLDPDPVVSLLGSDVVWESQMVLVPLVGRETVMEYLLGKMETLRDMGAELRLLAELGRCADERGRPVQVLSAYEGRPCVLTYQGDDLDRREPSGLVLVEMDAGRIRRVDLCTHAPVPAAATRLGVFPGLAGAQ